MLYTDEFKPYDAWIDGNNDLIHRKFQKCGFYICTGKKSLGNRVVITSSPSIKGLSLNEYQKVIVYLIWHTFRLPSFFEDAFDPTNDCHLHELDYLFTAIDERPFAIVSLDDAERLYVNMCQKFGEKTKSTIGQKCFCKICQIPLMYYSEKCWACERGI